MEDTQALIEQVKTDISSGKSEEEIFQYLLPQLGKNPQTSGRLAELMGNIPDRLTGRLLHRMFEITQDKKVRKIIKRSLYRLKSKGVVVEEISSDEVKPVLRPFQEGAKEGFASGIDFLGHRLLWLLIPRPGGGVTGNQGIVRARER